MANKYIITDGVKVNRINLKKSYKINLLLKRQPPEMQKVKEINNSR